jgi:hypothetical protein
VRHVERFRPQSQDRHGETVPAYEDVADDLVGRRVAHGDGIRGARDNEKLQRGHALSLGDCHRCVGLLGDDVVHNTT